MEKNRVEIPLMLVEISALAISEQRKDSLNKVIRFILNKCVLFLLLCIIITLIY